MDSDKLYQKKDKKLFEEVAKLMKGDESSYAEVYHLSEKYIYKIIHDIVKNHQTTEDLMQETYLQIYKKISTLQDAKAFYVWAGRIATNYTYRHIQKYRKEVLLDTEGKEEDFNFFETVKDDTEEFIPESVLMNKEKQRLIAEIIDNLSVEQKLSIQYYYYEEMSVNDISEAMECSPGTVKSRLNYARKAIKEAVVDLDHKKGTRLYSLSAAPLFYLVFQDGVSELAASGVQIAGGKIIAKAIGEANIQASASAVTTGGATVGAGTGSVATSTGASLVFAKAAIVAGAVFMIGGGVTTAINYNYEEISTVEKVVSENDAVTNPDVDIYVETNTPDWSEEVPEVKAAIVETPQPVVEVPETKEEAPQEETVATEETQPQKETQDIQTQEEYDDQASGELVVNSDGSSSYTNFETGQVYYFTTLDEFGEFELENATVLVGDENGMVTVDLASGGTRVVGDMEVYRAWRNW